MKTQLIAAAAACLFAIAGTSVLLAADVTRTENASPAPQQAQSQQPQQQRQPSAQPQQQPSPPRRQNYSDRYAILSQKNIFLRDRTRPPTTGPANGGSAGGLTTQPARRSVEESLVLRGVVLEQGAFRAYVEDLSSGALQRLNAGDRLGRGRISSIEIDAIEYEPAAAVASTGTTAPSRIWIAVGSDLTGRGASLASDAAAAAASTQPVMPTGIEGLNPNDPNLTMEQRLKLRRAQEMNRR